MENMVQRARARTLARIHVYGSEKTLMDVRMVWLMMSIIIDDRLEHTQID